MKVVVYSIYFLKELQYCITRYDTHVKHICTEKEPKADVLLKSDCPVK